MQDKLHYISEAIHESQIMTAIIFGMFMQFFLVSNKTWRVAAFIGASGMFVASYVVYPAIEFVGIEESSRLAVSIYALSSLLSMEILAIILTFFPLAVKDRLTKILGIKDVTKK